MTAPCTRLWEVSAARDDRLDAADRASHERHASSCQDCRDEARQLERLADELGHLPVPNVDEIAARRARLRLLSAASKASEPRRLRVRALVPAVALLAAAAASITLYARHRTPTAPSIATVRPVDIRPASGARWSSAVSNSVRRIELVDGALTIEILHVEPYERAVVTLPDGVLEDVGTRFLVEVKEGRTERVVVHEGAVLLRLHGRAPLTIGAGGSWSWSPSPVSVAPSVSASVTAVASTTVASTMTVAIVPAVPKPVATPAAASALDPAGLELKGAMASLRAGENALAAARFATFVTNHPAHPQAEDAAWLRVVASQRAGDTAGTRAAAADYLARFPKGFRRPEAEALKD